MAGTIKISTAEVRTTVSSIRTLNTSLNDDLLEIQSAMTNLKNSWQSDGCDAIQAKFAAVASKYFQNYYDVIESYAKFLEQAVADSYERTETVIESNANAFN